MTAHRSKGLQWRLVVVASVQEGQWPDLRRRGSLLEPDRLGPDGLVDPLSAGALLAEERRLFYVAITRARERLIVTAVQAPEADGDQPSRLLAELDIPLKLVAGTAAAAVVVARSGRRSAVCAGGSCVVARVEAGRRRSAGAVGRRRRRSRVIRWCRRRIRQRWWGVRERTRSERPIADPGSAGAVVGECADDDRGLPAALVPAAAGGWRDAQYVGDRVRHGVAHAGGCGCDRHAAAGRGRAERLARQGVDAAGVRVDVDLGPGAGRGGAGAAPVRRVAPGPAGSAR